MFGAQSVHSSDTSTETTAPLAAVAASTIDWSKRTHWHFKFVDVSYYDVITMCDDML